MRRAEAEAEGGALLWRALRKAAASLRLSRLRAPYLIYLIQSNLI
jgi:hypothetical protein